MQKLKQFLSNYFGITPSEANGFLGLSMVIIMILGTPYVFKQLYSLEVYNATADQTKLDSLIVILEENQAKQIAEAKDSKKTHNYKPTIEVRLIKFNPNRIDSAQWVSLGVSPFIARRIINYRNKGGAFRYKSDVLRIYDFPEATYKSLKPYIQLPEKTEVTITTETTQKQPTEEVQIDEALEKIPKKTAISIALNLATAKELQQIKGIGLKLSERIVKFRDKLGGFHSKEQIYLVYGLDSAVCQRLLEVSTVDDTLVKKIFINSATQEELASHPFIHKGLARVLVNYRKQHGNYTSSNELRNIKILDEETLQKLLPYLSFE